jgi:hypothetical protein
MKTIRLYTESGDKYKIKVKENTSEDELEKILKEKFPDEWEEEGPGFRGSYIHIEEDGEYEQT